MKHANVAIFVPHNGCPHQCSFCNQKSITGKLNQPKPQDVIDAVKIARDSLKQDTKNAEIAFFGGSFTAIERSYMISLLSTAYQFVKDGTFSGIRLSTRPDYIDDEILSLLKKYGVTTIELGAQSMDDRVLKLNGRGHTAKQIKEASRLIKSYKFRLGLQMMTGLYGDTLEGSFKTAEKIAELNPENVRIYPTIIMEDTELGDRFLNGEYKTFTLEQTVELCAKLLDFFEKRNITVIRLGLHNTPELQRDMLSGPWHPAFRELCESKRFLNKVIAYLENNNISKGKIEIKVNSKFISVAIGQKKHNLKVLSNFGYFAKFIQDKNIVNSNFAIKELG